MADDAAREIALEVGSLRLAARAWGEAGAPPVLALHGWLDNAASFDHLAPWLDGVQLVALDFPGHGHSDHRPPGPWYHFVDYVADVVGAADALGWQRFALLGHSLGGAVATFVAAACPERVTQLALIEALGPLTDTPAHAPARLAEGLARASQPGRRPPPVYPDLEGAVEARRGAGGLSAAAARPLVTRGTRADDDGVRWRSDPRLRRPSPHRFTEDQVLATLAAIRAPTLAVAAADGLVRRDPDAAERRAAAVPGLRLERLPGHHHLHLEDPDPVAALLGPFLRGEPDGSA